MVHNSNEGMLGSVVSTLSGIEDSLRKALSSILEVFFRNVFTAKLHNLASGEWNNNWVGGNLGGFGFSLSHLNRHIVMKSIVVVLTDVFWAVSHDGSSKEGK